MGVIIFLVFIFEGGKCTKFGGNFLFQKVKNLENVPGRNEKFY
jgi:hypothetical protein